MMQYMQMRLARKREVENQHQENMVNLLTPPTTPEDPENTNPESAEKNESEHGELKIDESAAKMNININNDHKPVRISVIKRRQIN